MFLQKPDLTSGSRPLLLHDETLLFVQDGVGLYEGKYKIATCQKGHAYLTSHRACYVDDIDPRKNSLAIELKDVDRHELQARFLRSSPKVTLHRKPLKGTNGSIWDPSESPAPRAVQRSFAAASSPVTRTNSPLRGIVAPSTSQQSRGTWVCPICSFSNLVPPNFDSATANPAFPTLPCLACGIKPPFPVVLRAAITAAANRSPDLKRSETGQVTSDITRDGTSPPDSHISKGEVACPRCTFHNHYSLPVCELCGAPLPTAVAASDDIAPSLNRPDSPGPQLAHLTLNDDDDIESVKFSFRTGGEKAFFEKLKVAMVQRRWLLQGAPPIPRRDAGSIGDRLDDSSDLRADILARPQSTPVGIAGLERRGLQVRKNNESVIGTAFEDLEALMASAKEIVALAEKFAQESGAGSDATQAGSLLSDSAAAMGMIATKDMLGDSSGSLYTSELSRNLAEYVTDERRGVLRRQGGIMSLVDLWSTFNRSRNGVELISPADFYNAAQSWERLALPVRLRQFKSGLLVVQPSDWTDEKTLSQFRAWLRLLKQSPSESTPLWDRAVFGCGVTAQDAGQRFGWSVGVATEELEMAEDRGLLCREEGIEGLKFWLNPFVEGDLLS